MHEKEVEHNSLELLFKNQMSAVVYYCTEMLLLFMMTNANT